MVSSDFLIAFACLSEMVFICVCLCLGSFFLIEKCAK